MRLSTNSRPRSAARNVMLVMTLAFVAILVGVSPAHPGVDPPGPPSGDGIQPVVQDGNPTCGELAPGTTELRVNSPADGTFTDGTLTVTIDVRDTPGGQVFDWTSNIGIDSIFAKGGDNGNLYVYDPEDTADTSLHAPVNPSGTFAGLSHISFCYDADVPPTTAPPTTAPPTTAPPTTAPPVTQAAPPPPPPPPPGPAAAPPAPPRPPAPAARPAAPSAPVQVPAAPAPVAGRPTTTG